LGKNTRLYLKKITKNEKRTGEVAQVVGYLPSKPEVLSSNPNTFKKNGVSLECECYHYHFVILDEIFYESFFKPSFLICKRKRTIIPTSRLL
jgi:hypothetical protein